MKQDTQMINQIIEKHRLIFEGLQYHDEHQGRLPDAIVAVCDGSTASNSQRDQRFARSERSEPPGVSLEITVPNDVLGGTIYIPIRQIGLPVLLDYKRASIQRRQQTGGLLRSDSTIKTVSNAIALLRRRFSLFSRSCRQWFNQEFRVYFAYVLLWFCFCLIMVLRPA